ncbi:MAG: hypothetical protein J6568_01995 [Snodgrassella sp.]|nr:hypothetical protein [Snodgrassella sp.]
MKLLALISKYTLKPYRRQQTTGNSVVTANLLQRQFDVGTKQQIIVTDLSYIRANHHCNYLYMLLNLSTRQIARLWCWSI